VRPIGTVDSTLASRPLLRGPQWHRRSGHQNGCDPRPDGGNRRGTFRDTFEENDVESNLVKPIQKTNGPSSERTIKVGFVLLSPAVAPLPSTRVAALNMFPFLRVAGFDPRVVFEPAAPNEMPHLTLDADQLLAEGYRIVCFQKVSGPSVLDLARALAARGIKTVFMVCDLVDEAMVQATDITLVVTDFLVKLYPTTLQHKIRVVHDGIERQDVFKRDWRDDQGSSARPLRAVLVTSAYLEDLPVLQIPPPWLHVIVAGRYPKSSGRLGRLRDAQWHVRQLPTWKARYAALRFMLHPRITRVPWHPVAVYELLRSADVGILPIDAPPPSDAAMVPSWMVKSENRLTLKMAIGLPVVATPIPSYEAIVEHGVNGFLARSRHEWTLQLERLRDPALRRDMGEAARASVIARYSMEVQAERLISSFEHVLQRTTHVESASIERPYK
jgi:hypothetical protein